MTTHECQSLLDSAVAAHDEYLADRDQLVKDLTREAIERILPELDSECVEIDKRGHVNFKDGPLIRAVFDGENVTHFRYFAWRRKEFRPQTKLIFNVADLGEAIKFYREKSEEEEIFHKDFHARLDARNAALDEWKRKPWWRKLFSKRPK